MKYLTLMLLAFSLSTATSFAKVFTVEKSALISKRSQELKDIILDVENTCESGCKYKVSNVREMKIVDSVDKDHFYTWTYIDSTKDSYSFSFTEAKVEEDGSISIHSRFPDRDKIAELKKLSGHSHHTMFDDVESTWTLKENFNENHEFLNTEVRYSSEVSSSSVLIRMFAGTVRSALDKTARELFENFQN